MTRHCLDLFCGLGGFSSAFADSDGWDVTTVDIRERFDPDIQADVFDLRPSDFHGREFDVVLASPPCQFFSAVRSITAGGDGAWDEERPATDGAMDAIALVYHTVGLIRGLDPEFWVLENPRGRLRSIWRPPEETVWQCQYGRDTAKPTDLWGDLPVAFAPRRCWAGNGDCDHVKTESYKDHGGGSDNRQGLLTEADSGERAKIPRELSEAIRDAVDAALDGTEPRQATLGGVES